VIVPVVIALFVIARVARRLPRVVVVAVTILATFLSATTALAAPRLSVAAADHHAPLALAPRDGGYAADLLVANTGDEPLVVSRIAIRGSDTDVRSPARITVRFADGPATSATIAPGASKLATVRWMPERDPRVRQALGHVVVTSTDEATGEVAIGFRGTIGASGLSEHHLSLLLALPLVAALAAFASRAHASRIALAATAAELALAAWAFARFVPDVGRADGNDGLQLVEHAVWLRSVGVEYFVGIDGAGIVLVMLVALVALVATVAGADDDAHATVLALVSGLIGVVVAQDVALFAFAAVAASVACVSLVGRGAVHASARMGVAGAVAFAFIAVALVALVASSGRAILVDGTGVGHASAFPDLARAAFGARRVLGAPLANVAWVALFAGFGLALPMFPLHSWLVRVIADAPARVAAIVGGAVLPLVPYTMLRTALVVLPEATRWGAGALAAFGAVTVVHGALCALAQRDLRRAVAYGAISHMGVCFVGLAALTPQGILGALAHATTQGLSTACLLLVASAFEERGGRFGSAAAPRLSAVLAVALFAWAGAPGLAGFWGFFVSSVGAFAEWPAIASVTIGGSVLAATVAAWTAQRTCIGAPRATRDLEARDAAYLAPLVVAIVLLGVWPVPLLSTMAGTARDAVARISPTGPDPVAER
jgi:NADH-quinone oxidoreductase subunit M